MRKLLVMTVFAFVLLMPLASAQNITYVADADTFLYEEGRSSCSVLTGGDNTYCNRLEELGYKVSVIKEEHVRDDSTAWQDVLTDTDLVFIGEVSDDMFNMSVSQAEFCGNIVDSNKKVFNAFRASASDAQYQGCAYDIGLATPISKISGGTGTMLVANNCTGKKVFRTHREGYVTRPYLGKQIELYKTPQTVYLSGNPNSDAWVTTECIPYDGGADDYPVVVTGENGVFWGLPEPSEYTNITWDIFDRTMLFIFGQHVHQITTFTVPSKISANNNFMAYATVKQGALEVTTGTTQALVDGNTYQLTYNNLSGYWESGAIPLADDASMLVSSHEGNATADLVAGSIGVTIVSGNYEAGTYTISAAASREANLTYRVLGKEKFDLKHEGAMELEGSVYQADVELGNWSDLILEVTATNDFTGEFGGAYKIISTGKVAEISRDYRITPSEWAVTTSRPEDRELLFEIESVTLNMTDIRVGVSGELSSAMSIDDSSIAAELSPGDSTTFTASLNMSALKLGRTYRGEITVSSSQFDYIIPVAIYYYNIRGDFLRSTPSALLQNMFPDEILEKTVSLTNDASFPTTDIEVSFTGKIADFVRLKKAPLFIRAGEDSTISLLIDASGIEEGVYNGEIIVNSSLGTEDIVTEITVLGDVTGLVRSYKSDLIDMEKHIRSVSGASGAAELLETVAETRTEIGNFENATAENDLTKARVSFETIEGNMRKLEDGVRRLPPQPLVDPYTIIAVVLIIGGGFVGYILAKKYIKKKKKHEKKKKEERKKYEISPEDRYRVEYY